MNLRIAGKQSLPTDLIKLKYKNNKSVKKRCGGAVNNNRSGDCKHLGGCAENKTFVLKFKRR